MFVLLDSFRKFKAAEDDDAAAAAAATNLATGEEGCQLFVACEAGKMRKQHKVHHSKYGKLPSRIHKILR